MTRVVATGVSTQLPGHSLREDGRLVFHGDGRLCPNAGQCGWEEHSGRCACGALSPVDVSIHAARRWHRAHKDEIRSCDG